MSEHYIAWNGDEYPWPPPDGWERKHDGRYWPADREPPGAAPPTSGAPHQADDVAVPGFAAPDPAPMGPPTSGSTSSVSGTGMPPPPHMPPPPGGHPGPTGPSVSDGFAAPPPPSSPPPPGAAVTAPQWSSPETARKGRGGIVLLAILGFFVLIVAGCIAAVAFVGDSVGDIIQETFDAQESVEFTECEIRSGDVIAAGSITNPRNKTSDFIFGILVTGANGQQTSLGPAQVSDLPAGAVGQWVVGGSAGGLEGPVRCEVETMVLSPLSFGD